MWQAEFIQGELKRAHPGLTVNILGMTTKGDQILDSPLAKVGGKGLFVKELETALLDGRADLAVHSAKDMPAELPDGLSLQIVSERETPLDALVMPASYEGASVDSIEALPQGSVVGTSSLRRKCQLLHIRPDLQCMDLRGNINTRLAKLDAGNYDAIVLAASGLQRIGFNSRIACLLPDSELLPAVGQGALAVETRSGDSLTKNLFDPLIHHPTQLCVAAERAMNAKLEGGCQVPIAGFATYSANTLTMSGRVGSLDGTILLCASAACEMPGKQSVGEQIRACQNLGLKVATNLLEQGAGELLASAIN